MATRYVAARASTDHAHHPRHRAAGLVVENEIGFPALTVVIGGVEQVVEACNVAWEHGILFTPAAFPAMPLERGGLRLSVTAANTDEDVDTLLEALEDIAARVMARISLTRAVLTVTEPHAPRLASTPARRR